jgi:hypothetical protein
VTADLVAPWDGETEDMSAPARFVKKSEWQGGGAGRGEARMKTERRKEKKEGRDGTVMDGREAEEVDMDSREKGAYQQFLRQPLPHLPIAFRLLPILRREHNLAPSLLEGCIRNRSFYQG